LHDDKPAPGDWVLIHVGFAMSKISEQDAADQMNTLRMLGEIEVAVQEAEGYGLEDVPEDANENSRERAQKDVQ
jgi:hydrogenase expression/formation protein HypC